MQIRSILCVYDEALNLLIKMKMSYAFVTDEQP